MVTLLRKYEWEVLVRSRAFSFFVLDKNCDHSQRYMHKTIVLTGVLFLSSPLPFVQRLTKRLFPQEMLPWTHASASACRMTRKIKYVVSAFVLSAS